MANGTSALMAIREQCKKAADKIEDFTPETACEAHSFVADGLAALLRSRVAEIDLMLANRQTVASATVAEVVRIAASVIVSVGVVAVWIAMRAAK